jgi:xanthine dehydrogenase accessory factor
MEWRETHEILNSLREARALGRRAALATIVRVSGSAYRREGARMLIRDDGAMTCMLSGGCLEPAVVEVAREAIRRGQPVLRHYDLEEDVVWGLGLGCGGTVDIHIEPVTESPLFGRWVEALDRGELALLATPLNGSAGRLFVGADGTTVGAFDDPAIDAAIRSEASRMLAETSPRAGTQMVRSASGEATEVFFDISAPPNELVIFGAGHDAIPVSTLAQGLGWNVTVVDGRAAFTTPDRFPGAHLVLANPAEFEARVRLGPRAHALVMNHHLARDQASLACALRSEAPWIGVLGPRSRFEKLVDGLRADGVELTPGDWARTRSPVGLDIGAESPGEVALAIVAALIAERRGFRGGLLDGIAGRIHDPGRGPE